MSSLRLAAALALVLACNPDDPGTTATTSGTGTTAATTGTTAATTDTSSGEPTTDGTASGGMTAAPTTSTATSTATTEPATSEPATSTSTSTDPGTSTDLTTATTDDTGAVDPQCLPAVGDYGACQTVLGWAFDGAECTLRSGCDCAPDCDKFFPGPVECAQSCAAADNCNPDHFEAAALAEDPVAQGNHCDGVYMCPGDDAALKQAYQQIFGMLPCEPGAFPCGPELCAGLFAGTLGPDEWQKMCAASLLPLSGPLFCVVFGP